MSFDDYMFVAPGFLRGAARALDIGGNLGRDAFIISPTPGEADRRALRSDWRVTGRDIAGAFKQVEAEVDQQSANATAGDAEK